MSQGFTVVIDMGTEEGLEVPTLKRIGPFSVHHRYGDSVLLTVTHQSSGRAVAVDISSMQTAELLAYALMGCGADWSFTKASEMPPDTYAIARPILDEFNRLRHEAGE